MWPDNLLCIAWLFSYNKKYNECYATAKFLIQKRWRALVDTLRTLPELRLVVMRYPEMKRQHIGEMLWQRETAACSA